MPEPVFKPHQPRGRFTVELVGARGEGWNTIDNLDGACLESNTRDDAENMATFARAYVKRHGDVDFNSFPYKLEDPLVYDQGTKRPWIIAGAQRTT